MVAKRIAAAAIAVITTVLFFIVYIRILAFSSVNSWKVDDTLDIIVDADYREPTDCHVPTDPSTCSSCGYSQYRHFPTSYPIVQKLSSLYGGYWNTSSCAAVIGILSARTYEGALRRKIIRFVYSTFFNRNVIMNANQCSLDKVLFVFLLSTDLTPSAILDDLLKEEKRIYNDIMELKEQGEEFQTWEFFRILSTNAAQYGNPVTVGKVDANSFLHVPNFLFHLNNAPWTPNGFTMGRTCNPGPFCGTDYFFSRPLVTRIANESFGLKLVKSTEKESINAWIRDFNTGRPYSARSHAVYSDFVMHGLPRKNEETGDLRDSYWPIGDSSVLIYDLHSIELWKNVSNCLFNVDTFF